MNKNISLTYEKFQNGFYIAGFDLTTLQEGAKFTQVNWFNTSFLKSSSEDENDAANEEPKVII